MRRSFWERLRVVLFTYRRLHLIRYRPDRGPITRPLPMWHRLLSRLVVSKQTRAYWDLELEHLGREQPPAKDHPRGPLPLIRQAKHWDLDRRSP